MRAPTSAKRLDSCGAGREKHELHELPSLPAARLLSNANGQLEDGIAKIAAKLGDEHRSADE